MTIRQALLNISQADYSHNGPADQEIFQRLRDLRHELEGVIPRGYRTAHSAGVGNKPIGLWVAVLNPTVSTRPSNGIYFAVLFNAVRNEVTFSIQIAATEAQKIAKTMKITMSRLLRIESAHLRALIEAELTPFDLPTIVLGNEGSLPDYERANVVGRTYSIESLPSVEELLEAVDVYVGYYDSLVKRRREAMATDPGTLRLPARLNPDKDDDVFLPKSSAAYQTRAKGYQDPQLRDRYHEEMVKHFGEWCRSLGMKASTKHHPVDIQLKSRESIALVEVKKLHAKHPAGGIREAIGQLLEYRKFLYPDRDVQMIAVFNLNPGGAFVDLLRELGISVFWVSPEDGTKFSSGYIADELQAAFRG